MKCGYSWDRLRYYTGYSQPVLAIWIHSRAGAGEQYIFFCFRSAFTGAKMAFPPGLLLASLTQWIQGSDCCDRSDRCSDWFKGYYYFYYYIYIVTYIYIYISWANVLLKVSIGNVPLQYDSTSRNGSHLASCSLLWWHVQSSKVDSEQDVHVLLRLCTCQQIFCVILFLLDLRQDRHLPWWRATVWQCEHAARTLLQPQVITSIHYHLLYIPTTCTLPPPVHYHSLDVTNACTLPRLIHYHRLYITSSCKLPQFPFSMAAAITMFLLRASWQ